MRRLRFTIAGMMGLVLVAGIMQVAIWRADSLWSSFALTIAVGIVFVTTLASVVMPTGPGRAGWFGATLFGGLYLALCFIPPFAAAIRPHLFTSQILAHVHPRLNYGAESGYYLWPPYHSEEAQRCCCNEKVSNGSGRVGHGLKPVGSRLMLEDERSVGSRAWSSGERTDRGH